MRKLFLLLATTASLFGAPIYTTSFEAPTFTVPNPLTTFDSWTSGPYGGANFVRISNASNGPGSQAAAVLGNTAAVSAGAIRPVSHSVLPGQNILLAADVYVPDLPGKNISFDLASFEGSNILNQLIGYVRILPDLQVVVYGSAQTNTAATVAPDAWNRLGIWANFANRTFDVELNGNVIASNQAFTFNTNASQTYYAGGFASSGPGATASGFYFVDNFSISTSEVPEPGTVLLVGAALGFVALRRRR